METQKEQLSYTLDDRIKAAIEDITFGDYVKVVFNDFSTVCIANDVTEEEKQSARSIILAEFADAVGDIDYIASVQAQYKQMRLSLKQLMLIMTKNILQITFDNDSFEYLKTLRLIPRNSKYPSTLSELNKLLDIIQSEISLISIDIADTQVSDKKTSENTDKPYKPSKRNFIKLLASVSQFVKFNVTFETNCAVVAEYVARMKQQQLEAELRTNKK